MAGMDEALARLTNNPSFLDWLRGNAEKRGVPSWKDTTAGRSGGFPGRELGMPLAPGNSPSAGRLGGTYTPSGNMPVAPPSMSPSAESQALGDSISRLNQSLGQGNHRMGAGGSGVGGPPASLSGVLGNAARGLPWNSAMLGPIADIATRKDQYPSIEAIARSHQNERDKSLIAAAVQALRGHPGASRSPQSSNGGGTMMPIPIPPASAASIQAQPIPNATGNMPAQLVKDQSRMPAQPPWLGMAQTPNNVPPTPGAVPLPMARPPQAVQQVPMPTPRPRIPLPTPRPQMPIARPVHPAEQAAQNKSILDTLLSSFDPNAAWRQQYR